MAPTAVRVIKKEDYEANYVSADAAAQLELEFSAALF